jgi:hypothetical protein
MWLLGYYHSVQCAESVCIYFFLQICHNKSGEINPIKISSLVEAYVKKYRYAKKKNAIAGKGKM